MRKIRLVIEYDGTAYRGWQIQKKELMTVQGIIEDRISGLTGEKLRVIGASRTDAGVHAFGQVAAFRTKSRLDTETIKRALNALLPLDIRIIDVFEAEDSFSPRYSAVRKSYFYVVANQRESTAFLFRYAWLVQQPLDLKSMIKASKVLIGTHDFSTFMGTGSSIKNTVREIFSLNIEKFNQIDFMTVGMTGEFIKISIEADGFLRHMVRNIVGTLVETGRGNFSESSMMEILAARNRRLAGPTAPPNGLYLEKIIY
ncbi:MAG: tRNA pseudouridine(38-40) synthase TruA [Nitrospirae bacterium]|jgi:tRNA pseudouridine38-40 synthase|nr:tRNA pseudouridine(38-40) synthase TruA [Nitrospirota bacterium]